MLLCVWCQPASRCSTLRWVTGIALTLFSMFIRFLCMLQSCKTFVLVAAVILLTVTQLVHFHTTSHGHSHRIPMNSPTHHHMKVRDLLPSTSLLQSHQNLLHHLKVIASTKVKCCFSYKQNIFVTTFVKRGVPHTSNFDKSKLEKLSWWKYLVSSEYNTVYRWETFRAWWILNTKSELVELDVHGRSYLSEQLYTYF